MKRTLLMFAMVLATPTFAQTPLGVEGVWKVVEVTDTSGGARNSAPQPALYIFTKKHYSIVAVNQPRTKIEPLKTPRELTDAEKIAAYEHWARFTANSGTYELQGTHLTTHPLVAKNERVMSERGAEKWEWKMQESILWLTSENGYQLKLTRLE